MQFEVHLFDAQGGLIWRSTVQADDATAAQIDAALLCPELKATSFEVIPDVADAAVIVHRKPHH